MKPLTTGIPRYIRYFRSNELFWIPKFKKSERLDYFQWYCCPHLSYLTTLVDQRKLSCKILLKRMHLFKRSWKFLQDNLNSRKIFKDMIFCGKKNKLYTRRQRIVFVWEGSKPSNLTQNLTHNKMNKNIYRIYVNTIFKISRANWATSSKFSQKQPKN